MIFDIKWIYTIIVCKAKGDYWIKYNILRRLAKIEPLKIQTLFFNSLNLFLKNAIETINNLYQNKKKYARDKEN